MLEIFILLHVLLATSITVILATQFYKEKNDILGNNIRLPKKKKEELIRSQITDAKASFLLNAFLSWMFPMFVVIGYVGYKVYEYTMHK